MRKKYITPSIANYGACATLIQGSCGWGTENLTLDKTGYKRKEWAKWVPQPCAGPDPSGHTNCYAVCSKTRVCSNKDDCELGAKKKI